MADKIENIIDGNSSNNNNNDTPEWKKITGDKYKTEAELAKAYKDLEKKLGEVSEEVKQSKEFATIVNPILDEIRNDPEIFNKLDKKIREKNNPNNADDNKDDKKQDNKAVEELRTSASDLIIARFEETYEINKLPAEERKTLRQKMGDVILDLTGKRVADIDLRKLNPLLENAYVLATKDKRNNQDDSSEGDNNSDGAIGSLKSSQGKGESNKLTSEESKVAESLGLTRDQYLAGKKK